MSSASPGTGLPASVLIELASTGFGLARWVRLRTLWDALTSDNAQRDEASLAELGRLLDGATSEAQTHAAGLVAFYKAHADEVNALFDNAMRDLEEGRQKSRLHSIGPHYASGAASIARAFLEETEAPEPTLPRDEGATRGVAGGSDPFCNAVISLLLESDVGCLGGDAGACEFETWIGGIGEDYACW